MTRVASMLVRNAAAALFAVAMPCAAMAAEDALHLPVPATTIYPGDTIRDEGSVSPFMVRNSVAIVDGGCLQPMTGRGGDAVIPDDADDTGPSTVSAGAR